MDIKVKIEAQLWDTFLGTNLTANTVKDSANILYGDGRYVLRKNPIGTFFSRVESLTLPGVPKGPGPSFSFALPKIPKEILAQQVSFYRGIMGTMQESEAFSFVFWDLQKKEYFVYVPFQIGCKGRVKWDQPNLRTLYPADRYIEVISGHSHNTMHATFSAVDDKDENSEQLYMVLGTLHKEVPSFSIRACLMGNKIPSQLLNSIFNITEEEFNAEVGGWRNLHPKEWETQIKPMDRSERATFTDKEGKQITLNFGNAGTRTKFFDFNDFLKGKKAKNRGELSDKEARGRISRLMKAFLREVADPDNDLEIELGTFLTQLAEVDSSSVESAISDFVEDSMLAVQYNDMFPLDKDDTDDFIPKGYPDHFKEWPTQEHASMTQEEWDFFYDRKG